MDEDNHNQSVDGIPTVGGSEVNLYIGWRHSDSVDPEGKFP